MNFYVVTVGDEFLGIFQTLREAQEAAESDVQQQFLELDRVDGFESEEEFDAWYHAQECRILTTEYTITILEGVERISQVSYSMPV